MQKRTLGKSNLRPGSGRLRSGAHNGKDSRWYQAAVRQKTGRISAAGMTKEVAFELAEEALGKQIDDAYRAKYKGSPYSGPMIGNVHVGGPENRAAWDARLIGCRTRVCSIN